jgi:hypothetical protein
MTYARPTWEYDPEASLLILQRMQNRVLCATGNLGICTPVRELHVVFKIPYMYDYIAELCRTQAEVILNHVNPNVRDSGQGEPCIRNIRGLNFAVVRPTTDQLPNCSFRVVK